MYARREPVPAEDPQAEERRPRKKAAGLDRERAPNTLPTNFEYTDQFIPNWNSWTRAGRDAGWRS